MSNYSLSANVLQTCDRQGIRTINFKHKTNTKMKNKTLFKRFILACASLLLLAVISYCGTTHIEFTIIWKDVMKTIGLILIGALITLIILCFIFRNFRVW